MGAKLPVSISEVLKMTSASEVEVTIGQDIDALNINPLERRVSSVIESLSQSSTSTLTFVI